MHLLQPTFFKQKENNKWVLRSPNGSLKYEIDFIVTRKGVVKDAPEINKLNIKAVNKYNKKGDHEEFTAVRI